MSCRFQEPWISNCINRVINIQNIWEGVKKGNRDAQKALYDYSCDDLTNVCKRYLSDASFLDAVQETYIKIFTKSKAYDSSKGSLSAWMARIAVNECLHILRKQKKIVFFDVLDYEVEDKQEEEFIADITAEEIYNEVEKLPIGYRTVFNLFVVEGYTHKEIGEILKLSPSSSRSQLARAKSLLVKNFKKKTNLRSYEATR